MRFGRSNDEPEPPDPVFDEDKDLSEVWPEVVRQYEKTTKRKLDTATTFKGFQLQIDTDIKESKTKSHQHARTVLNNVGDCVEKFGCIVAQGASVVFGPSAQCWNAISFVIQAVRGFSDMMDGFITLMERSSAFMRRLVRFMEKNIGKGETHLPHLLRKPAYEILAQFLGVLQSSYKLATSTRERVKRMAGIVLFNSDDKVAESLELMEGHIKDFTRAEIDEILQGVGGLAKHLDKSDEERARYQSEILEYVQTTCKVGDQVLSVTQQIKATLDGRASKEQQDKNLEKLANYLGPKKAGDWETWSKRHSELCKVHVEGTGEWLSRDETEYIKWSDIDQHDRQILFLQADSGFGKTHLFSHVVSHLEKKCRAARGPNKAYLAYYYYGDDKDDSLERCIGSIIYQFAAADAGYAQAVVDQCGRLTGIARAEDRWNTLVSGLQHAMKGTYFICMDGFDGRGQLDTVDAMISTIACQAASSAKSNGISLRLFVSGNEDALSDISQRIESIHTIVLGQHGNLPRSAEGAGDDPEITLPSKVLPNASDLKAVTRARIKDVCRTKPGLKAILSEENIELLLEGIRGNYKSLEAKITEINACDTKGKVQNIINNTSADMDLVQRNRVKTLDALLSSGQAQVLNELLVWVAGLIYQPSTKLLESVLFLTSGEEFLLADQIATTYSPVLSISKEGSVGFKDGLRDILSASGTSDSESALTQLHDEAISAAEVNLCRRFIKNACDPTDYARFRFADFFDAMEQKVHIHLDDDNSVNVTIIDLCVRSLFDSRKHENLDELRDYASKWFYWHLKSLVEALDSFEPNRKFMNDIGAQLVDLIYDPCMIDSWFVKKHLGWLKSDFLYVEDFIDPLLKFLKNPQVTKGYAKDATKSAWVKSVVSNSAKEYSILERVAARLASHWFSCSNGTMDTDYLWIPYGVFAKISKPDEPFSETGPSLVEVDKFICWAKEHIDIDPDSSTWDFRVGATHVVFQHHKEAIVALEKVEKHFQNNWGLLYNLASAHESDKNHCSALKYIQDFKSLSSLFFETDKTYKSVYYELLLSEGNCHRQRHDYDLAVKSFQDLLGRDIDEESGMRWLHLEALSGLFTIWSGMKSYKSIIDFVRSWKHAAAQNRGPIYWLRRAAYDDASHTSIIVAAENAGVVDEVLSLYQDAIDYKPLDSSTMDQQEINVSAEATEQLQYFQAVLRFHGSKSSHDQHRSIQYWEEIIQRSDTNPALHFTAYTASRKLAPTLLDKAVAEISTSSSSSSESYISRLERFANLNTTVVCNLHQGYLDPRLCLARLYFLRKDHTSAFKQARARLCSVFDKWPEATNDNSLPLRFSNLAQTLTVLDADADAVAAWQAIEPDQPSQVSVTDTEVSSTGGPTNARNETSHTYVVPATADLGSEKGLDASSSATAKAKAYISEYICDGDCGTVWEKVLADCHVCRHCLCVQFCSGCYKKLLAGDLHPLICNKDHKMLFLPPFDWRAWRTMPADMMSVDKQLVPRREWIDRIRKEYDVQQEQIDMTKLEKARELKAASVIAVQWRNRLKRIRDKKPSTVPTLRRVKTVG